MDIVTMILVLALSVTCFLIGMITEHIAMKSDEKEDQNWIRIPTCLVGEFIHQFEESEGKQKE